MKSTYIKYVVLCVLFLLITESSKSILHLEKMSYNTLAENLTDEELQNYVDLKDKWQWISYVFVPLILLIKTTLTASILYIGTFFFSKIEITFKALWNIVIKAEFLFLLVPICKIVWFYFFQTHYTLEDIQYFYPLSALNIVGYKGLETWFIYPFQTLNLFELAYWIILAYYIGQVTQTNTDRGLKIVACSYGSALLLWVVTIMFFTLNYS
jgi:hypothetical protein